MARSFSALILLFLLGFSSAGTELRPVDIQISLVDTAPAVEQLLERTSSSPFNLSCEAVKFDANAASNGLRRIVSDETMLRTTPVRVELPNNRTETFWGKRGGKNELSDGYSVCYQGLSKFDPVSYFAIRIYPNGATDAFIRFDDAEYSLEASNRLPTHFLCQKDSSFNPEM